MNIWIMLKLLHTLEQLRKHERWTRPQLKAYQDDSLRRLREHAYAHSPFYQRFHKGFFDRPLAELPVLTKAMMMEHFDEFVTDRSLHLEEVRAYAAQGRAGLPYKNRYRITATSGSSGQPGFFLFDPNEWMVILASFARSQEWSGVKIDLTHRQKMATVASLSPWHISSQVAATVKSWWRQSLRLPATQALSHMVQQLNDWQPEVLIAYASMVDILAEEQLAGKLHIKPSVVYAASEVLTEKTRKTAADAWGDEPFNQYAATETASIAVERRDCRHMHFFEDLLIAEVVDEHYRPVPPGEYGSKVLITTLFSRTQPLIRYELNDSLRVSAETGSCGLPFTALESIQGRVEDDLELPGLTGGRAKVHPLIFNRVMDIARIGAWQVAQQADDGLVVFLRGANSSGVDDVLIHQLIISLAQEGVAAPYIRVEHVAEIPKTASGKTPLIQAYRPSSLDERGPDGSSSKPD
ncbi:MAG: phenylacetate--CoA ligase family protein [Chloroflexota bacterium]|nr:MAG: phenylacetate--CoA ligase family protein [Chloroflexota bacterium]